MDIQKLIAERRSVRTFREDPVEEFSVFRDYLSEIGNPYGIPVRFELLNAGDHGLSSPVIRGESLYVAGAVQAVPHSEEAFGYCFADMMLYAWSLGLGTTCIGGTMNRDAFEEAMQLGEDERMYCVTPLGYPAERMSLKEAAMRAAIRADKRKPAAEMFFDGAYGTPLIPDSPALGEALEAVRRAPSAVNHQPWRIIRCGCDYHFYVKHSRGYASEKTGDMQKVDLGIALYHFLAVTHGQFSLDDPSLTVPADTEYIATVTWEAV